MEKVQVQAEIDVRSFLSQLETKELEAFLREATALLNLRKAGDKKAKEAELLRRLNEECALPEEHWRQFRVLTKKRDVGTLTVAEQEDLFKLIKVEETMRLRRIRLLGELAQVKGITLMELATELGIKAPDHAG